MSVTISETQGSLFIAIRLLLPKACEWKFIVRKKKRGAKGLLKVVEVNQEVDGQNCQIGCKMLAEKATRFEQWTTLIVEEVVTFNKKQIQESPRIWKQLYCLLMALIRIIPKTFGFNSW